MVLMAAQEIDFGGERQARMVVASAPADAETILAALGIAAPDAVLMIFGGASNMDAPLETQIADVFRSAILPAASAHNALIIDGGTQAGIMEIVGKIGAEGTPRPIMLGVAPFGKVTFPGRGRAATANGFANEMGSETAGLARLDPNHSHFALTPTTEWGSETETMFRLAVALSARELQPCRVAALLFNGGMIARQEALSCVRHGWPLIALQGTGRLADQIAQVAAAKLQQVLPYENAAQTSLPNDATQAKTPPHAAQTAPPEVSELAEIAASDNLIVVSLSAAADALAAALK